RMRVDIPPPGLDIGLQIGDAVDDGHGESRNSGGTLRLFSMQKPHRPRLGLHPPHGSVDQP
ncbi:MAG: hypothetical protein WA418_00110, partial [Bradyrhizobium sp.]